MILEKLTHHPAILGEGPCWHEAEQKLYWVDILGKALHRFDPATGSDQHWELPERIGTVAPRTAGDLILALENGFAFFNPTDASLTRLPEVEPLERTRFNDGKCDPQGRFWCGSMDLEERETLGSLYRLDPGGTVSRQVTGLTVSNGLAWNEDRALMYHIDSPTRRVTCFDFDPADGSLHGRRTAFEIPETEGFPDGMTLDREGKLWIGHWGGAQVCRWDPDTGNVLQRIAIPAPATTACCFGGPDLRDLYITTARVGLDANGLERYPDAGCLFRVRLDVAGAATHAFSG